MSSSSLDMEASFEDFVANRSAKRVSKLLATESKTSKTVWGLLLLKNLSGVHYQNVAVRNFERSDNSLERHLESMKTCFAL